MYKADNSMHVFVSTVTSDISENLAASSDNQIVILDKNGAAIGDGSAVIPEGTLIQVAMKDAAGNARFSPLVEFKKANVTGVSYAGRTEQTTTLDLCDDTPNTRYTLRINFKHNVELFSNQSDQYFFEYTTGDTVTAGEVMANFVLQVNLAGGTTDKVVAAADGTDGMTILGLAQTWSLGLHADTMVLFDVNITGFVAAATNVVTGAAKGSGSGKQVAELEWFGVGASGAPYRHGSVPSNADLIAFNASSSGSYDVASLDCVIPGPSHAVAGAGVGRCQIILAMPIAAAGVELDEVLGFTDDSLDIFS
tara:strand:- start:5191 stop:6114 length:924 start_codon:yes stop_codon:yes gene_type:complete